VAQVLPRRVASINMAETERERIFGFLIAILSGGLQGLAMNLVSYVTHQAETGKRVRTACELRIVDAIAFVTYLASGLMLNASFANGNPVAVGNATATATTLLCNMLMQACLGITHYSRSMQAGTWTMVVAVCQMTLTGPSPVGDVEVMALLSRWMAQAWCVALLFIGVAAAAGIFATRRQPSESMCKIFTWSVLLSITGCISDYASSFFGLLSGGLLAFAVGLWLVAGAGDTMLDVKVPAYCNVAVFAPLNTCVRQVLNLITGIFIWEDYKRVKSLPTYISTFLLCALSVYLTSEHSTESPVVAPQASPETPRRKAETPRIPRTPRVLAAERLVAPSPSLRLPSRALMSQGGC